MSQFVAVGSRVLTAFDAPTVARSNDGLVCHVD